MWDVERCEAFAILVLPATINVFQMTENLCIFFLLLKC